MTTVAIAGSWRTLLAGRSPRSVVRTAAGVFAAGALFLGLVFVVYELGDEPMSYYTRDAVAISETGPLAGIVSQTGILLWAATFTVLCLAWFRVQRREGWSERARFLAGFGALTGMLLLDDMIMIHENLFPRATGLPEQVIYASYMVALLVLLVRFRRTITTTPAIFLLISLAWMAASLGVDRLPESQSLHFLLEDGTKFLGIVFWCAYFVQVAFADATGAGSPTA